MSNENIPKTKPPLKFGKPTRQFSVRLPIDTIDRIKSEGIDAGQILYDVIEDGKSPYSQPSTVDKDEMSAITTKLVQLMIDNEVKAPENFFTSGEVGLITLIVEEKL